MTILHSAVCNLNHPNRERQKLGGSTATSGHQKLYVDQHRLHDHDISDIGLMAKHPVTPLTSPLVRVGLELLPAGVHATLISILVTQQFRFLGPS